MRYIPKYAKLRQSLRSLGIQGAIVLSPENFFYVTGLSGHQLTVSRTPGFSLAVVSADETTPVHITTMDFEEPSFMMNASAPYVIQKYHTWVGAARKESMLGQEVQQREPMRSSLQVLEQFLNEMDIENKVIGIEMAYVPMSYAKQLQELFPEVEWRDISGLFVELRSVKDEDEIAIFRTLCKVADDAFYEVSQIARAGVTERELVQCFRTHVIQSGLAAPSAWSMFSAGSNAARLTLPGEKAALPGEVIKFDAGVNAEFQFYTTDTSRTWVLPGASKELLDLKDKLYEAQRAMIAFAKPGVTFAELFSKGYNIVQQKYPNYLRGHLGHSISLGPATAEDPYISIQNQRKLVAGMILAIEVPCYMTDYNGFNIEDMVLISDTGTEVLTPKTPHYL